MSPVNALSTDGAHVVINSEKQGWCLGFVSASLVDHEPLHIFLVYNSQIWYYLRLSSILIGKFVLL